jgi:RecA/RadA recombinase
MSSIAIIRSQVECRIPGALTIYERSEPEVFSAGIPALDGKTGGIPKGALTQVCAPAGITSGRTSLLLSLLAQVTG